jgi:hypothetical protein
MVGDTTPGVSPLRPLSGLSEFPIVERLTRAQVVSECSKSVSGMPQCVLWGRSLSFFFSLQNPFEEKKGVFFFWTSCLLTPEGRETPRVEHPEINRKCPGTADDWSHF